MSEQARPVVVDAAAVLDFLLQLRRAPHIGKLITQPLVRLHAPDTLDREVVSVLRRQGRAGDLKPAATDDVLRDFASLSVELHPSRPYLDRVWGLRSFVHVGDAYYVALAEALEATLLTSDEKLARGLARLDVNVLVP